jgi:hypothetical protein
MHDSTIPIPPRMRALDLDPRGYPIPYMVWRDRTGRPHFTINDEEHRLEILKRDLCSICGQPLKGPRWMTGGPLSAFHEHGAYNDPPMHEACLHYAMVVCPYLAAPSYARRIDAKTVTPENREGYRLFMDITQIPDRPDIFVCVLARTHKWGITNNVAYSRPKRPYLKVEYWRHGRQLSQREGERISAEIMSQPLPERLTPRIV